MDIIFIVNSVGSYHQCVICQESPTDIHSLISQRLEADGLSPQCGEGEKLLYLWRLYQQLEVGALSLPAC